MAGRGRGRASTLPAWMTKADNGAPGGPAVSRQASHQAGSPAVRGGGGASSPGGGGGNRGPLPPPRNGQFDDAPEPRRDATGNANNAGVNGNGYGGCSPPGRDSAFKRSQSPGRRLGGSPQRPPQQDWRGSNTRERSRSRDREPPRNYGGSRDREPPRDGRDDWDRRMPPQGYGGGRKDRYRPERRSRSRERGGYGSRNGGGGGDYRYAERGYSSSQAPPPSDRYESYFRSGGSDGGASEYRGRDSYSRDNRRDRSPLPAYRSSGNEYYDRGYGGGGGHDDRTSRNYSDYRR